MLHPMSKSEQLEFWVELPDSPGAKNKLGQL